MTVRNCEVLAHNDLLYRYRFVAVEGWRVGLKERLTSSVVGQHTVCSIVAVNMVLLRYILVSFLYFFPLCFAFTIPSSSQRVDSALQFGIPSFLTPKTDDDNEPEKKETDKKLGWKGLVQLITAGAGAPFLGDFQGVDEETGNFMFSLEANNLVDENGNSKQTSMPYFESGWVDPEDEKRAQEGFKWPWDKK